MCEIPNRSIGSGLTRRQRSLVIIIMILFCYICFGALVISFLLKLSFINSIYFTLTSIETIGFGDIVPKTTGARVFVCIYVTFGVLTIGVAIGMIRETVLEAMEVAYRRRTRKVMERWKDSRKRRRVVAQWKRGIEWRLKEMRVPVWIREENWQGDRARGQCRNMRQKDSHFLSRAAEWAGFADRNIEFSNILQGPHGMRLNLDALTRAELEASALEAGVPLDTLLPSDCIPGVAGSPMNGDRESNSSVRSGWTRHPLARYFKNIFQPAQDRTPTQARVGGMAALLTRFAVAAVHRHSMAPDAPLGTHRPSIQDSNPSSKVMLPGGTSGGVQLDLSPTIEVDEGVSSSFDIPSTATPQSDKLGRQMLQDLDKKVFYSKLIVAWGLFFVFWTVSDQHSLCRPFTKYARSGWFCNFFSDGGLDVWHIDVLL